MKKFIVLLLTFCICITSICFAQVYVKGYFRKDGTYVAPHFRTDPDNTITNNYSYPGNYNPNSGEITGGSSSLTLPILPTLPTLQTQSTKESNLNTTTNIPAQNILSNKIQVDKPIYDVKINDIDISEFAMGWEPFVYEHITYIPMTSYLVDELNLKLDFSTENGFNLSSKSDTQNVSTHSDYSEYFYVYENMTDLKDYVSALRQNFIDAYSYYNLSYYDRNYHGLLENILDSIEINYKLINLITSKESTFTNYCVKHGIATEQEVKDIFNLVNSYSYYQKMMIEKMENNAERFDYTDDFVDDSDLSRTAFYEILDMLDPIKQKASNKF